jgi:hypothetical protein
MAGAGFAPAHPLGYGSVWSVPIEVKARQLTGDGIGSRLAVRVSTCVPSTVKPKFGEP